MSSGFDQFESLGPPSKATLAFEGEPHEQLKRNLKKALLRQDELLDVSTETVGGQMVVAGVAATVVKAALTTDRTALKARSDNNSFKRVLLKLLFLKVQRGDALPPDRLKLLTSASREEIEAALGPLIRDYDLMNENAG